MKQPEICIPITEGTKEMIIQRAKEFATLPAEYVEWRMDFFAGVQEDMICLAKEVKAILQKKQLVATLRTVREGGEENGKRFDYESLLVSLLQAGDVDYVDVEVRCENDMVQRIMDAASQSATKVIGSFHDFSKTLSEDELVAVLEEAKKLGTDVGKVACMPQGEEDVQILLHATERMNKKYPDYPLITMSMGDLGKVTRLYGGLYGSFLSFGCVGKASAPGQIELMEMKEVFDKLYGEKNHIALIGFMGVGKSTISRKLREITGRKEYDTDQMIVEQEGCAIADIFSDKGEPYFRQLETDVIDEIATMEDGIISCGGGMALKELNVKKLQAIGNIVLLTATPETIYERVKDSTDRPLLNGNMNVPYIQELMEKRRPYYEKAATVVVSTDGKTVEEIANEIVMKCL